MKMYSNPHVLVSQFSPEYDRLLGIYEGLAPKKVLEIGSQYGGTLWEWLRLARQGTTIVNIDLGLSPSMMPLDLVWQSWVPEGVTLKTIFGDSHDMAVRQMAMELLDWNIDFAFIDGDHTYKGVRADWLTYGIYSKVCAFHDLVRHQPHFGVWKLWDEIKANYKTEELWSGGSQNGGGIGVVYVSDST